MINKQKLKMTVDMLMTICLFILISYQYVDGKNHEIVGTIMFGLFIVHNIINVRWYTNIHKGKHSLRRILQITVNILVFADMIGLMVSSIIISRYVFDFLPINGKISFARSLHMVTSYLGFILMSIHLGLHAQMIIVRLKKHIDLNNRLLFWISKILAVFVAGYGIYALINRNLFSYILLKNQFVFFDYDESVFVFLIDYMAIMGLFVIVSIYIQKVLRMIEMRIKGRMT